MIRKLKRIVLTVAAVAFASAPALALAPGAYAATTDIQGNLCAGTNFSLSGGDSSACNGATNTSNFENLLKKIINIFSAIVGVIAVIMIIIGGLRYITSGGDSSHVSTAKTTIIYALVGLIIVALAQLIVHFVLTQTSSLAG